MRGERDEEAAEQERPFGCAERPVAVSEPVGIPVFRGLLNAQATELTMAAQRAAAHAIADTVEDLDAGHIVPSVFDERLVPTVARAVAEA